MPWQNTRLGLVCVDIGPPYAVSSSALIRELSVRPRLLQVPGPGWLSLQAALSLLSFRRFVQSLATLDQIEAPVRPSGTTAGFRLAGISGWGCAVNLRAADITGLGVQA